MATLVASMTIGAVCLKWMLPTQPVPASPSTHLIAIGNQPWSGIQVNACPENAVDTNTTAHFVVDRDGKPIPTDQWRGQRPIGSETLIHIALLASASSHQTTDAQAKGARELVRDLNRRYGIPANKVVWETPAGARKPLRSGRS